MKKLMSHSIIVICLIVIAITLTGCGAKTDFDYIQSKGNLIIGYAYNEPMMYADENGNLVGFDMEFATEICKRLGITPVFQQIDWGAKETELAAKNIDCIWAGTTKTPEREKNMDFSTTYLNNYPIMVVRKGSENEFQTSDDIENKTVVALVGSTFATIIESDEIFAKSKPVFVDANEKALMEVSSGVADIAMIDYVFARVSIKETTDFKNLAISNTKKFEGEEFGIAFRKNSPETVSKVNAVVEEMKADGTLKRIAEKYGLEDLLI